MDIDWPRVVTEHGPRAWRVAWRLLGNAPEVEDCFQRTFLSAFELARRQRVRDWAGTIHHLATVRALERLRERSREAIRTEALPLVSVPDQRSISPQDAARAVELGDALRDALGRIDPQLATAFTLVVLEDVPYRDVSARLGTSESHVGVLVHRARKELQRRLARFSRPPTNSTSHWEPRP